MADYTINLYPSVELHDHCVSEYNDGWRATERGEAAFQEAFSNVPFSANISAKEVQIPAPTEDYTASFYASPCVDTEYFPDLGSWWYSYWVCNVQSSADVNLLVTKDGQATGGGAMDPSNGIGLTQTGAFLGDVPLSPSRRANNKAYDCAGTLLHEFAHYAMDGVPESHLRGDFETGWGGTKYVTPMLDPNHDEWDGENHCGEAQPQPSDWGHIFDWHDCCTQEW